MAITSIEEEPGRLPDSHNRHSKRPAGVLHEHEACYGDVTHKRRRRSLSNASSPTDSPRQNYYVEQLISEREGSKSIKLRRRADKCEYTNSSKRPSMKVAMNIRALRVGKIFGCQLTEQGNAMLSQNDVQSTTFARYLVKWEQRSYRELCWVSFRQLVDCHEAEVKIANFNRRCGDTYLRSLRDICAIGSDNGDTPLEKSKTFLSSGGWRVPRINVDVPKQDLGNFCLFAKCDRVIGARPVANSRSMEYLVKWNLLGYQEATWERQEVFIGDVNLEYIYDIGESVRQPKRADYEFYFDASQRVSWNASDLIALRRFRQFSKPSVPTVWNAEERSFEANSPTRPALVENDTGGIADDLWKSFRTNKLGPNGVYLPAGRRGSLLADEMGLGKTCQSIVFVEHLLTSMAAAPGTLRQHALVILQKSVLENWKREFDTWAPHLNVVAFSGGRSDRNLILQYEIHFGATNEGRSTDKRHASNTDLKPDIILATYETLRSPEFRLISSGQFIWNCVVVDECQKAKGGQSSLLLKALLPLKRRFMLLLSGTPIQNTVGELFPLLALVDPEHFDYDEGQQATWTEKSFQSKFGGIQERDDGLQLAEELQNLLAPYMLRREKEEVLRDLPPKHVKLVRVPLTLYQKRAYSAMYTRSLQGRVKTANIHMQLRKICIHPFMVEGMEELLLSGALGAPIKQGYEYGGQSGSTTCPNSICATALSPDGGNNMLESNLPLNDSLSSNDLQNKPSESAGEQLYNDTDDDLLIRASGKFILANKMLLEYRQQKRKVLIFSFFKSALDLLEEYAESLQWITERIDGQTATEERQLAIDRFNEDPERFIFLCTTRAGGLGINLTSASVVIHLDSDFNPQHDLQAQARCHRIGQHRDVEVFHLVAEHTYEDHMLLSIAGRKLGLEAVLLGKFDANGTRPKVNREQEEIALRRGVFAALTDDSETVKAVDSFAAASLEEIMAGSRTSDGLSFNSRVSSSRTAFSTARFDYGEADAVHDATQLDPAQPDFWERMATLLKPEVPASEELESHQHRGRRSRRRQVDHLIPRPTNSITNSNTSSDGTQEDHDLGLEENQGSSSRRRQFLKCSSDSAIEEASDAFTPDSDVSSADAEDESERSCSELAKSTERIARKDPKARAGTLKRCSKKDDKRTRISVNIIEDLICFGLELSNLPSAQAAAWFSDEASSSTPIGIMDVYKRLASKLATNPTIGAADSASKEPLTYRVFEWTYRTLIAAMAWRKTEWGAAKGIRTEDIRRIDAFSVWGIQYIPSQVRTHIDASLRNGVNGLGKLGSQDPSCNIGWLRATSGVLEAWKACLTAWRGASSSFKALCIKAEQEIYESQLLLSKWFENPEVSQKMFDALFCKLELPGVHEENGKYWAAVEELAIKLIFVSSERESKCQSTLTWPPPLDEADWHTITLVVNTLNRLLKRPERRREAICNRFYNRLDSRWNDKPFTEAEKRVLAEAVAKMTPVECIARELQGRNLEKVRKGMRSHGDSVRVLPTSQPLISPIQEAECGPPCTTTPPPQRKLLQDPSPQPCTSGQQQVDLHQLTMTSRPQRPVYQFFEECSPPPSGRSGPLRTEEVLKKLVREEGHCEVLNSIAHTLPEKKCEELRHLITTWSPAAGITTNTGRTANAVSKSQPASGAVAVGRVVGETLRFRGAVSGSRPVIP